MCPRLMIINKCFIFSLSYSMISLSPSLFLSLSLSLSIYLSPCLIHLLSTDIDNNHSTRMQINNIRCIIYYIYVVKSYCTSEQKHHTAIWKIAEKICQKLVMYKHFGFHAYKGIMLTTKQITAIEWRSTSRNERNGVVKKYDVVRT